MNTTTFHVLVQRVCEKLTDEAPCAASRTRQEQACHFRPVTRRPAMETAEAVVTCANLAFEAVVLVALFYFLTR